MTSRSCFCGCDRFRFVMNKPAEGNDPQELYYNICRNCNHSLGDHLAEVRSRQAE